MRLFLVAVIGCLVPAGCSATSTPPSTSRQLVDADPRAFYARYESALKAQRRDTLAHFYHPDGAAVVVNGERQPYTRAGIDSIYRGPWTPPLFMSFDDLHFESLDSGRVIVTGRFRWLTAQSPDTAHYAYLSILEQTRDGLKIRLEHETQLRDSRRP